MKFNLSLNEVLFIKKNYRFDKLLGIDEQQETSESALEGLLKKQYIYNNNNIMELSTEIRLLFASWSKMRYSLTLPEQNTNERLQCLLSNADTIIALDNHDSNIEIEFGDYSVEVLNSIIREYADLKDNNDYTDGFVIRMSLEEFNVFLTHADDPELLMWQNKLGISNEVLMSYLLSISSADQTQVVLIEDHWLNIGCLIKIVYTNDAVFALKHITPEDPAKQRMVLLKGDTQLIMNSLYNF